MGILLNRKRIRKITDYFNSEKGLRKIPYSLGCRYIHWFCSTHFALHEYFRNKTPIVREFLAQFPGKYDEKKTTQDFLRLNYLHGWRASSFTNLPDKRYFRKLKLKNYDVFLKEYKSGKGVVLVNSHFGLPSVVISMFPALGYNDFHTIIGERFKESTKYKDLKDDRKPNVLPFGRGPQGEMFKYLYRAKEILESGGILHILGDGMHGMSNVNLEFLGKVRGFRSSFAELGLIAGSSIIPVFAIPANKGRMHVEFHEPLEPGNEETDHSERVENIIKQYSALLERRWLEKPSLVNGGFMEMYNKAIVAKD